MDLIKSLIKKNLTIRQRYIQKVKIMLIERPKHRVKVYDFSLTDEERKEIRKNKKNSSSTRKKFDGIIKRAEARRISKIIGEPWDRCEDRPRVKRWV